MIRHIVLVRFEDHVTDATIAPLWQALHELKETLGDRVLSVTAGRSESPEEIERGYMHGFVVDFSDWDALEAYQTHPDHKALGAKLVAHAKGGIDGILVFDLPVPQPG